MNRTLNFTRNSRDNNNFRNAVYNTQTTVNNRTDFAKGLLGQAGIQTGGDFATSLVGWGIQTNLMHTANELERKNMRLNQELSIKTHSEQHAINAKYHKEAGLPYIPGGGIGSSAVQYVGNNYTTANLHTAGVAYRGTQAQRALNVGNRF